MRFFIWMNMLDIGAGRSVLAVKGNAMSRRKSFVDRCCAFTPPVCILLHTFDGAFSRLFHAEILPPPCARTLD